MNYFAAISKRCDELTALANEYLEKLPFLPNDEVCQRIFDAANRIFEQPGEHDDWIDDCVYDHHIPFGQPPRNGSLYYSLGWSVAMQDARLRNLLEIVEGRETEELEWSPLAEQEIVDSYTADAA